MAAVMCECGAVLVKNADENGVVTLDGTYVRFQRRTDYIACATCLRSYQAVDILPPKPPREEPVERMEKLLGNEPGANP